MTKHFVRRHRPVLCAVFALLLLGLRPTHATALDLIWGSDAPTLAGARAVQGALPAALDDGGIYVIEFWATWCAPCERAIPHLNALAARYQTHGVRIIGITQEDRGEVRAFLQGRDDEQRPAYSLALDPDGALHAAYFGGAEVATPKVYVVGRSGRVEWDGHPNDLNRALAKIVEGSWDPYVEYAWRRSHRALEGELSYQRRRGHWVVAMDVVDALFALHERYAADGQPLGDDRHVAARFSILTRLGDYERAYAYANTAVLAFWDNPQVLNELAWTIVDEPTSVRRDLPLAMAATARSNELSDHRIPGYLDTLARAHYESGDLPTALTWQRRALDANQGHPGSIELVAALARYEVESAGLVAQAAAHAAAGSGPGASIPRLTPSPTPPQTAADTAEAQP